MNELPQSTDSQEKSVSDKKLQIAWAYQNKPEAGSMSGRQQSARFGHYWDVSTVKEIDSLKSKIHIVDTEDFNSSEKFIEVY